MASVNVKNDNIFTNFQIAFYHWGVRVSYNLVLPISCLLEKISVNYYSATREDYFLFRHVKRLGIDEEMSGINGSLANFESLTANQLYQLGKLYFSGRQTDRDHEKALRLLHLAAANGSARAQNTLGVKFFNGDGVEKDHNEAIMWLSLAANQGNALALYNLGIIYTYYLGEKNDYKKAFEYLTLVLAAKEGQMFAGKTQNHLDLLSAHINSQDIADVQYELGKKFAEGKGVEKNIDKAILFLTKAANLGHIEAQNNLGFRYYLGRQIPKDAKEAIKWFSLAAKKGDPKAIEFLQKIILSKEEQADVRDAATIVFYELVYTYGQPWLGILGDEKIRKELGFTVAERFAEKMQNCEQLPAEAIYTILHTSKDFSGATKYVQTKRKSRATPSRDDVKKFLEGLLKSSADQGYAPAQGFLGIYLLDQTSLDQTSMGRSKKIRAEEMRNLKKVRAEGIKYLEKAADQDNIYALNRLGSYWDSQKEVQKAAEYYSKSAELGSGDGYYNLAMLCIDDDPKKGMEYLYKADELGDPCAQLWLGKLFYKKEVSKEDENIYKIVSIDEEKALYYLNRAARNGDKEAAELLKQIFEEGQKKFNGKEKEPSAFQQRK